MAKNKKRRHLETKRKKFENKDKNKLSSKSTSDSNPFEFHRNKVKHNIIGRQLAKNEIGNKGLARNRAFNKRKNTLLEEYKRKHKSGKGLQDLRNSETNDKTEDWKRLNNTIDMSITSETVLTHKGKHLNDFIDDRVGSDDEDLDLLNRPDFVESTHFGGGSDGRPKSTQEVLTQIMDEKREKQLERAANIELTEKLDSEWNAIKNILRHKGVNQELNANTSEDFDVLVKELMFNANKPIVEPKRKSIQENTDLSSDQPNDTVKKSVETLFKETFESIEKQNNWTKILDSMKATINELLPQISEESLSLLFEKYQTIVETKSYALNARNYAFITFGLHFKETKQMVKNILIEMLAKIRYNSFTDIGIVLLIIKTLLIVSNGRYIPEVFNSIINVLHLTQPKDSVFGRKQKSKFQCNLGLSVGSVETKSTLFNVKYIFDESLNSLKQFNENQIKSMLILEALKRLEEIYDLYSTIPSFNELIISLKNICSQLSNDSLPEDINDLMNRLLAKLNNEEPKPVLIASRPKPFMLPMFEPKFDDNPNNNQKNTKKRLIKKYKRELKGAQRELRKDSTFMRNTWIQEIQANDQQRKRKVKELFGDLAQQQGLYKKKKK